MDERYRSLYEDCLKTWGEEAQLVMCIEEMAELTKEICKYFRGSDNREKMLDELTDIRIMTDQLELIFDFSIEELNERVRYKTDRIRERLKRV